jgi:hypothetical protein
MTYLYSELVFKLKINWRYDVYSLYGDPIGDEVRLINNKLDELMIAYESLKVLPLDSLLKTTSPVYSLQQDSLMPLKASYSNIEDSLKSLVYTVRFNTTKEFILLRMNLFYLTKKFYDQYDAFIIRLNQLVQEGIIVNNLSRDVKEGYRIIDSLSPKISYIYDLKPDANGIIQVNPEDTRLFRQVVKIADVTNNLAEKLISIQDEYNKLLDEYNDLQNKEIEYMIKLNDFLDIKILFLKHHFLAPNPYY